MDDFVIIDEQEVQDIRRALEDSDLGVAAEKIQDYFNQLDNITLNIAITGESGTGKSTFVNAFRDIGDEEENSAPTGVVETTMEPQPYPHPKYPNVQVWDLPGIGTPSFRADTYLEQVQFERYDFFIIIASERFKASNVELAMQIQKMGKRFYFVRSKIDDNMRAEKRKKNFNQDQILTQIRNDCIKGLEANGVESPKVFLISSFELGHYDFPLLEETMEKELPKHKRNVLLLALPNMTLEINKRKRDTLQADIWKKALLSGAVATVPIPGLSVLVDVSILVKEITRYYEAFGLNEESLQNLSARSEVPLQELKSILKSPLNKEISSDVVIKLLTKAAGASVMFFEYLVSNIPVVGSLAAGGISYGTTYYMLKNCLDELASDSQNVLMRALESEV